MGAPSQPDQELWPLVEALGFDAANQDVADEVGDSGVRLTQATIGLAPPTFVSAPHEAEGTRVRVPRGQRRHFKDSVLGQDPPNCDSDSVGCTPGGGTDDDGSDPYEDEDEDSDDWDEGWDSGSGDGGTYGWSDSVSNAEQDIQAGLDGDYAPAAQQTGGTIGLDFDVAAGGLARAVDGTGLGTSLEQVSSVGLTGPDADDLGFDGSDPQIIDATGSPDIVDVTGTAKSEADAAAQRASDMAAGAAYNDFFSRGSGYFANGISALARGTDVTQDAGSPFAGSGLIETTYSITGSGELTGRPGESSGFAELGSTPLTGSDATAQPPGAAPELHEVATFPVDPDTVHGPIPAPDPDPIEQVGDAAPLPTSEDQLLHRTSAEPDTITANAATASVGAGGALDYRSLFGASDGGDALDDGGASSNSTAFTDQAASAAYPSGGGGAGGLLASAIKTDAAAAPFGGDRLVAPFVPYGPPLPGDPFYDEPPETPPPALPKAAPQVPASSIYDEPDDSSIYDEPAAPISPFAGWPLNLFLAALPGGLDFERIARASEDAIRQSLLAGSELAEQVEENPGPASVVVGGAAAAVEGATLAPAAPGVAASAGLGVGAAGGILAAGVAIALSVGDLLLDIAHGRLSEDTDFEPDDPIEAEAARNAVPPVDFPSEVAPKAVEFPPDRDGTPEAADFPAPQSPGPVLFPTDSARDAVEDPSSIYDGAVEVGTIRELPDAVVPGTVKGASTSVTAGGSQQNADDENEVAAALARAGINVVLNPGENEEGSEPDYHGVGLGFDDDMDLYTPRGTNLTNIAGHINDKAVEGQATVVIVNLDRTSVGIDDIAAEIEFWQISSKMKAIFVYIRGKLYQIYP